MAKPWDEKPLWWKVFMTGDKTYIRAGNIIGHNGCSGFDFYDRAKLLPGYDKLKYERAVRDLCVYEKRERGEYELHANARKVLRIILGPAPDDPEYVQWWTGRMVSVRLMREAGQPVEWADKPPVPLAEEQPSEPPPKKRAMKKKAG